jgi:hypothetical protein
LIKLRNHLKTVNAKMPSRDPTSALFNSSGDDFDEDGLD